MIDLITYAMRFIGVPYKWGGSTPMDGFDCSGFVQWILESVGADPKGDQTAQGLHDILLKQGALVINAPKAGALCFYGPTNVALSHVSFCISDHQIVEAGGGDHTTTNLDEAIRKAACVRLRPVTHRKDLRVYLFPNYPLWVTNG